MISCVHNVGMVGNGHHNQLLLQYKIHVIMGILSVTAVALEIYRVCVLAMCCSTRDLQSMCVSYVL